MRSLRSDSLSLPGCDKRYLVISTNDRTALKYNITVTYILYVNTDTHLSFLFHREFHHTSTFYVFQMQSDHCCSLLSPMCRSIQENLSPATVLNIVYITCIVLHANVIVQLCIICTCMHTYIHTHTNTKC